jgi:AmmeMemoRadiSam system protein A
MVLLPLKSPAMSTDRAPAFDYAQATGGRSEDSLPERSRRQGEKNEDSLRELQTQQGAILLAIARAAISSALGKPMQADESAPWLEAPGATFVTLTQQGELRGCIGSLEAHRPLLADVRANALAAALRDPRFHPLGADELDSTRVEVSLLSPLSPINFSSEQDALAQLRPNVDGIVFECGRYRSTFLPQVWEQLPQPTEFMAHLKHKAGLSPGFWDKDVRLFRYTVNKWKESS